MKKRLLNLKQMLSVPLFLMLILAFSYNSKAQKLTLDQADLDYEPGETVYITGNGWQPGEEVILEVFNITYEYYNVYENYAPWTIVADENGNISSKWQVSEEELNTSLVLTADGVVSGFKYKIFFTDARKLTEVTIGSQSGSFTYATVSTITFPITVTTSSSGSLNNIGLIVSNLTHGETWSFSPTTVSASNSTQSPQSTLSITTTATTPVGATFTVTASDPSQNANPASVTADGSIIANKATPTATLIINNSPVTYDGTAKNASVQISTSSVPGSVTNIKYNGSSNVPVNAGTYAVTADFVPNNTTNYNSITNINVGNFIIDKATSVTTVTITGAPFTYTGSAIEPASVTVTGAGGLSLTPATVYTNNINAGTANAAYTYAGDDNHLGSSDSKDFTIGKAASVTTVSVTQPLTFTGSPQGGTASVTGAGNLNQSLAVTYTGLAPTVYGPSTTAPANAGTYNASAVYGGDSNHFGSDNSQNFTIGKASSTTSITIANETYDGTPHGGTAKVIGAGGLELDLALTYTGTGATIYGPSTTAPTLAGTYNAAASYSGDDNHFGSSDSKNYTIIQASTNTLLTLSGSTVRFMDAITFTAVIKPANTGSALTGTVNLKVGSTDYGTVNVVPIPGSVDGSVQAMIITQLKSSELPASYTVTATFVSSNANYSGSSNTKNLTVNPRTATPYNASGFYTGDGFAWTTGPNTSTATLTLSAVIQDNADPHGDVRGAKVSFYLVNGSTMSPISSAQNLPVGLIDVTDGSIGAASAIVQLNIGSANAASFQIAIKITGAYTNTPGDALSQAIVTVSKPVAGGYITGGSQFTNQKSSGYIQGATGLNTDYQFDIQYTKSGTNPKGKANIMVRSYYKSNGVLDYPNLHTYLITTNAIATLNVGTPTATGTFSAKANLVEQLQDLSTVAIEGGSTFQITAFQNGSNQQISITLYRKAGGIWFSSNWDATKQATQLQAVNPGSNVFVAGGGTTAGSSSLKIASLDPVQVVSEPTIKAYPNPFTERLYIEFKSAKTTSATLEIFGVTGAKLVTVFDGNVEEGVLNTFEYVPTMVSSQMVFYHLTIDGKTYVGKAVFQEKQ